MALRIFVQNQVKQQGKFLNKYKIQTFVNGLSTTNQYSVSTNTANSNVRVRFAPSPTGQIHLGGLRTALYNYLFAKSHSGKFLLRIEDTDQGRLVPGAAEKLVQILEWSGIEIDEGPFQGGSTGPYVQSQRLEIYREHLHTLIQTGSAYRCFCTPERLDLLKKQQLSRRETPKYDNRCRHLTAQEVTEKLDSNEPHIIRFKLHACEKPWVDLIYGSIQSDVAAIEGDPVLMKSDGFPTYHFANVVDDHLMEISHVLRGVEWQVSTKKHILLYEAFGWTPPSFAHLPLLVNKNGKKLSKREGDLHVETLKSKGYFPESLQNFLSFCGSGFTVSQSERKAINIAELVKCFDLREVNTRPSKLDFLHLEEINRLFMGKRLNGPEKSELVDSVVRTVTEHFKDSPGSLQQRTLEEQNIVKILTWAQDSARINLIRDLVGPDMEFLWHNTCHTAVMGDIRLACKAHTPEFYLLAAREFVESVVEPRWSEETLSASLSAFVKERSLPTAEFMKTIRLSLYGKKQGPPIAELLDVLGKAVTLDRLQQILERLDDERQTTGS